MILESITQPSCGSTIEKLASILDRSTFTRIDIAVAYITVGGAEILIDELAAAAPGVPTRWLTAFDYWRTEPLALETIRSLVKAKVRIHDPSVLARKRCMPVRPFHPKTFIFMGPKVDFVLAGSGNLSKSGLRRGHEAGLVVGAPKPHGTDAARVAAGNAIGEFGTWFKTLWTQAEPLKDPLLQRYTASYESQPNLKHPTPTDDDIVPEETKPGQIEATTLRKLRACRHLWVAGGKITPNLGINRPGNQLMLKRLTRVYFGFPAIDVPRKTHLGYLRIAYNGRPSRECSLTFAHNGMDRLTLPMPGLEGPPKYDHEHLLFRQIGPSEFNLVTGTKAQLASWKKRSKAIDASFQMSAGGREWGVF